MRVLVTRPKEDAAPLAAALAARGHETLVQPLLAIEPRPGAEIDLAGVQAVAFTSANGARVFAGLSEVRDVPVFAARKTHRSFWTLPASRRPRGRGNNIYRDS